MLVILVQTNYLVSPFGSELGQKEELNMTENILNSSANILQK